YQEVLLLRSGVFAVNPFLQRLGELLTRVYRMPGRFRQSLADASFDAWDVLYRPEPHHPNTSISYYTKGALVALALDLKLRLETAGRTSLDDVVRELWRRHGLPGVGGTWHGRSAAQGLARTIRRVARDARDRRSRRSRRRAAQRERRGADARRD